MAEYLSTPGGPSAARPAAQTRLNSGNYSPRRETAANLPEHDRLWITGPAALADPGNELPRGGKLRADMLDRGLVGRRDHL